MKQKLTYLILCLLLCGASAYAQKKTFTRDYTYQAGEADSKLMARANATTQMRNILLRELGEFLHTERTLSQNDSLQNYSEKIEAITAGIVEMKTLDEQWNMEFSTYYIKAEMTVDPKDLERRIAEVLNDKQKTKDLEEARKRTLAAEAEVAGLKKELERLTKELEENKNKQQSIQKTQQQRATLQKNYQQAAEVLYTDDILSAEEYFIKGENARENRWHKIAIEYYQKAIKANPNYVKAYISMGDTYYFRLNNYREAIQCYQKAIAIDPKHDEWTYYDMGRAYIHLGNHNKARQCFEQAAEMGHNGAKNWLNNN
jgi:tetratricopeptide (TPR) repeat protein